MDNCINRADLKQPATINLTHPKGNNFLPYKHYILSQSRYKNLTLTINVFNLIIVAKFTL